MSDARFQLSEDDKQQISDQIYLHLTDPNVLVRAFNQSEIFRVGAQKEEKVELSAKDMPTLLGDAKKKTYYYKSQEKEQQSKSWADIQKEIVVGAAVTLFTNTNGINSNSDLVEQQAMNFSNPWAKVKAAQTFAEQEYDVLKQQIFISTLRDIANDEYWNDVGARGLVGRKVPDTVEQYRDILNDSSTSNEYKMEKIEKITEEKLNELDELDKMPNYFRQSKDKEIEGAQKLFDLKRLVGRYFAGNDTTKNFFTYTLDNLNQTVSGDKENKAYNQSHKEKIKATAGDGDPLKKLMVFRNIIDPSHQKNEKKLQSLQKLVSNQYFWSDKGNKKNKLDDKHFDFTPTFILEYRKILTNKEMTQKDKISAIKEISKKNINGETEFNIAVRVNTVSFLEGEIPDLKKIESQINEGKREHASNEIDLLYEKLSKVIENDNWQGKAKFSLDEKKLPDGIKICREILLNNNMEKLQKIEAIFMICQGKNMLHKESKHAILFKRPTHHEITQFYKEVTKLSHQWHFGKNIDQKTLSEPSSSSALSSEREFKK